MHLSIKAHSHYFKSTCLFLFEERLDAFIASTLEFSNDSKQENRNILSLKLKKDEI